jgi:hypothetical protein
VRMVRAPFRYRPVMINLRSWLPAVNAKAFRRRFNVPSH